MACGTTIPPGEKIEIENDNEYEKKHDLMRILVLILVLVLPSLTLPRKKWGGELRCYRSAVGCVL